MNEVEVTLVINDYESHKRCLSEEKIGAVVLQLLAVIQYDICLSQADRQEIDHNVRAGALSDTKIFVHLFGAMEQECRSCVLLS